VSDGEAVKTAPKTAKRRPRGKPFEPGMSGNPNGRPTGSRNKTTVACEALLAGEAEAIVRKAIALAKKGDVSMIRALLGYILPPKPDRHITFTLPQIVTASDALMASRMIVDAVASGELSPTEGTELSKMIGVHIGLFETTELERRIQTLEQQGCIAVPGAAIQ
jgi:hypothetical protein